MDADADRPTKRQATDDADADRPAKIPATDATMGLRQQPTAAATRVGGSDDDPGRGTNSDRYGFESTNVYREAPGLYELDRIEWESTVTVASDEATYTRIEATQPKRDLVTLWSDGTRLASRRLERKVIQSTKSLLIFYRDRWVPLVRTTARETLTAAYPIVPVQQITNRLIVYQRDGLRVSHNKTASTTGIRFTVEYEIEYDPAHSRYLDIVDHERHLLSCFVARAGLDGHDADPVRALPPMEMATVFECVMTRLQPWNCFDQAWPYVWAYKWNGVKSKVLLEMPNDPVTAAAPDQTTVSVSMRYWADDCDLGKRTLQLPIESAAPILALLTNVCCAAEVLADRIVLLEAIGTQVSGQMHTAEPQTNRDFLDALGALFEEAIRRAGGDRGCIRLGDLPLMVQRYYEAPLPAAYDAALHDGFVIVQSFDTEGLIIRWKYPTTDVKCVPEPGVRAVRRSATAAGANQPVLSRHYCAGDGTILQLDTAGELGGIYEIDPAFKILRRRTDRLAASSASEYKTFLDSSELLVPRQQPPPLI